MKRIFTLIFASLTLPSLTSFLSIDDVIAALKTGNATQVAKYFDNTVDITLPQKSSSYSKSQAEMIPKDFLASNSVKAFTPKHSGSQAGSQYCIGTLTTSNGSYRTTIYMKQKGDKQYLQEIRFENE